MSNETKTSAWVAFMIISGAIFWSALIYNAIKSETTISRQAKEIKNLNNQMVIVTNQYNKLNHKKNELQFEVDYLRKGNQQLIENSVPCSVIKSIKKTPLPKLKGSK